MFFRTSFKQEMESLKPTLTRYLDINRKIDNANKTITNLRDERRGIELDLTALYNEKQDLPPSIDLTTSQLVFSVKKPGEWKKSWSLSKKQLEDYLVEILGDRGKDVMKEIVKKHEPKLVSTEYSFILKEL